MVTFTVDPVALRLRIVIDPKALPRQAIAIGAGSLPSDVVADHPKSSFVNYDVSVSTLTKPTSFIEAGYSHGNTLLYSSATVDPGGISSRGVTYATFDDPRHQTRTQIGTPTSPVVCCSTISRCSASANAVISNLTRFRTAFRPHGWNDRDAGHGERVRQWRLDSKRATAARKFQSVADPRYGRQQRRCGRRPGRRWKDANVRTIVFRGQFASGERYDRLRLQRRARAAIGVRGGLWDAGAGGNLSSWRKRRRDVRWNARSDRNGAGGQMESDLRLPEGAIQLGAAASSMREGHGAAFDALLALGGDPTSLSASVLYRGPTFAQIGASEPPGFQPPGFSTNVTLNHSFRSDAALALNASHDTYRNGTPSQTTYGATVSLPLGHNSELLVQLATTHTGRSRPSSTAYVSLVRTLHPGVSVATSASGGTAGVTGTTEVRVDPRSANTGIGYDSGWMPVTATMPRPSSPITPPLRTSRAMPSWRRAALERR